MEFIKLVESYKEDIIKSTQEIVQIKSVEDKEISGMPFGEGPYKALEYMLNLSEKMGFRTENLDGYAGEAEFGQGEEAIGILVHLDVVPEGDGWSYPPYGGEIHDGKIYGRGTIDDKGPAIAALYAMKALKESQINLNRKIRIIFGTNEETGWGCMKYYFKHKKPPTMAFTPDADFPVIYAEKGIIVFDLVKIIKTNSSSNIILKSINGGNAANMVPDYCEAILQVKDSKKIKERLDKYLQQKNYTISIEMNENIVKIVAKGISAHGSTPEKGCNAISCLMDFLGCLMDEKCDISDFIKIYNEKIGFKHHGENIGCSFYDDESGKLNFNPGIIKFNGEEISLTINIRYPINSSAKEVYEGIRSSLRCTGISLIEGTEDMRPLYVHKNNFLVQTLMKVYREQTGDMESKPITIGGGTYARAMDNAVAFGPMFPGQKDVAHQKDEYISIEHLMNVTKLYANALYELAK